MPSAELDGGEWFVALMQRRVGLDRDVSLSANPVPGRVQPFFRYSACGTRDKLELNT